MNDSQYMIALHGLCMAVQLSPQSRIGKESHLVEIVPERPAFFYSLTEGLCLVKGVPEGHISFLWPCRVPH